ncbi:MAG TPA: TMEM175 family protein [Planctomycetota bacterium]|jgi:uncharacterized membrane protein|nr:TMEM175 family protein [Planctomycetota bacterium]
MPKNEGVVERDTGRVEAFSDGVFAIAITLLILEIRVPELGHDASDAGLFASLAALWPSYVAFGLSFFVILIMWVNHHEFLRLVRAVDYPFLFSNGAVLLFVTFVPFASAVLAAHLGQAGARAAVAFYNGTFFVTSLAFQAMFQSVMRRRRLVRHDVPDSVIERIRRAYRIGPFVYGVSVLVALWNAWAGLALCTSLWILWTNLCYRSERPGARAS